MNDSDRVPAIVIGADGKPPEKDPAKRAAAALRRIMDTLRGTLSARQGFLLAVIDLPAGVTAVCASDVDRAKLVERLRLVADNIEAGKTAAEVFDEFIPPLGDAREGRA